MSITSLLWLVQDQASQLVMKGPIARNDSRALPGRRGALTHNSTRLRNDQGSRRPIPWLGVGLVETIEPATCDRTQIEGRGSRPPDVAHLAEDAGRDPRLSDPARLVVRESRPNKRGREIDPIGYTKSAFVESRSLPALCGKRLVSVRVVYDARESPVSVLHGETYRPHGNPEEKVDRAVQRIDDPAITGRRLGPAPLLGEDPVARTLCGDEAE